MKKLIELTDDTLERLESIKEKFNVKSLAPIVDIVLTIGLAQFENFASGSVIVKEYPIQPIPYQPYPPLPSAPQPWHEWVYDSGTSDVRFTHGNWVLCYNTITGVSNVDYKG